MDIPKRGQNDDSEKTKLLRENSYLSSNSINNYYGSTPTSLKIPNVSSISDFNEVQRAISSYNYEDEIQTSHFSESFKNSNNGHLDNNVAIFPVDSEASTSNQLTNSNKTTRQMNNFVSSTSVQFNNRDTNSLYQFMREQRKNHKTQIYESLDYEINENVLYLLDKKAKLKSKKHDSRFFKYLKSFFPSEKEFSRWFIIFLIGVFTALTACFIVANVDYFSELKYEHLRNLFNFYLAKNNVHSTFNSFYLNSTNNSFNTLNFDKTEFSERLFKLQIPLLFWFLTNAVPVFFGAVLVTYLAPVAAGSGIPVIKCYLNGVKVPEVVRIKTYIAKMFGVILTVVGGLASGKEGPLIHCGSIIAGGISQGKSTTLKLDLNIFRSFREDHEKRDFVSSGAAAGVSAAFGAPVGGVLFSLEEGASFWNQILTWRIFFCSLISTFTLNFIISAINGKIGQMSFPGLINFGKFDNINYNVLEIPIFILMGCVGGLIGAIFNEINHKITLFRMKYITSKSLKVIEAVFVAFLTAFCGFVLILTSNECKSFDDLKKDNKIKYPLQFNCKESEFSTMASLFLNNGETVVINMFHLNGQLYSIATLIIFFITYFFLSVVTYGLSLSSGIFIPALLIGSVYGRIVALCFFNILNGWISNNINIDELVSKFALLGAASVLGGVVRMTISLTVILIETTGNLTLGLPLMICVMSAKWVADMFNEGLYDIHIKLQQIPFLHCEPHLNNQALDEDEIIFVQQLMSTPVITLNRIETVRNIVAILQNETHYGFPIVDKNRSNAFDLLASSSTTNATNQQYNIDPVNSDYKNLNQIAKEDDGLISSEDDNYINQMKMNKAIGHYGRLRGIVLRWQLIVLLQKKIFNSYILSSQVHLSSDTFRDAYPRYDNIDTVLDLLSEDEMNCKIDLSYIMNPSPYSVPYNCSYERTFRLFRALGLRHLCIIDDSNNVVGIITRKDISHFKVITHRNKRYIQKYSETLM